MGGMGALNSAVAEHGGRIITVIHERWVVDHEDFSGPNVEQIVVGGDDLTERKARLREFSDAVCIGRLERVAANIQAQFLFPMPQVIVLPGGPGTFDELWELGCQTQLGFSKRPLCLVNVNGYYEGFLMQAQRAYNEGLMRHRPEDLMPSYASVEEALEHVIMKLGGASNGRDR